MSCARRRLIAPRQKRVGDSDILVAHAQQKGVWVQVFVGFQPQFTRKLDDWRARSLPMARGRLGQRLQLQGRQLADRRREAYPIPVALGRLDDLRSQRTSGVVVVPE